MAHFFRGGTRPPLDAPAPGRGSWWAKAPIGKDGSGVVPDRDESIGNCGTAEDIGKGCPHQIGPFWKLLGGVSAQDSFRDWMLDESTLWIGYLEGPAASIFREDGRGYIAIGVIDFPTDAGMW